MMQPPQMAAGGKGKGGMAHFPGGAAAPPAASGGKAGNAPARYKKAPDAPKRFKSAFIIFSAEKHKEIKEGFAKEGRTKKVSFAQFVYLERSIEMLNIQN